MVHTRKERPLKTQNPGIFDGIEKIPMDPDPMMKQIFFHS